MKRVFSFLLPLLTFGFASAQTGWSNGLSSRDKLMAFGSQTADVFCIAGNIASLGNLSGPQIGIGASRPFLLEEALQYNFGLATSVGENIFEGWVTGDRVPGLQQSTLGIAYARKLDDRVFAGIGINSSTWRFSNGYGKGGIPCARAGFLVKLQEKLQFGLQVDNVVAVRAGKKDAIRPLRCYISGLGLTMSPQLSLLTTITKEESKPAFLDLGLHYQPVKQFVIEAGMSTAGRSLWISTGFKWQRLWINCGTGYHPVLGFSPGLRLKLGMLATGKSTSTQQQTP